MKQPCCSVGAQGGMAQPGTSLDLQYLGGGGMHSIILLGCHYRWWDRVGFGPISVKGWGLAFLGGLAKGLW